MLDESFTLIPAGSVAVPRDEAHARALLVQAGCRAQGDELDDLARQVAVGTLLLARGAEEEVLDALDAIAQAPLLTTLVLAVG